MMKPRTLSEGSASYKLVILGDEGVGKSALTTQLCHSRFVEKYYPTIEDSYQRKAVIDGRLCMLEILDTAGAKHYETYRNQWIQNNKCFLLIYSITSMDSFVSVRQFHGQLRRVKDQADITSTSNQGAQTYSVMLVGNKSNKRDERKVSKKDGASLAEELGCEFVETSARTAKNVEKAFYDVVRIQRRIDSLNGDQSRLEIDVQERGCGWQCVIL